LKSTLLIMKLIDTHTHLYLPEFDFDRDEAVKRAVNSGIEKMLLPNIDVGSLDSMISTEQRYPGICHSMIGLHPTSVKDDYLVQLTRLEEQINKYKFVAIGEIGIDLYWDKTFMKQQANAFRRQISFARDQHLPVVIHSRNAFPEVFSVLEEFKPNLPDGVFHAFTGTLDDANRAVRLGFKLGIGGIVTFKNSGLDSIVAVIGLDNLILETDSPYLAPSPHRGKRCESSYIVIINQKIADILNMDPEETAAKTYTNSVKLFNLI
jgi:TatD DNase family protein